MESSSLLKTLPDLSKLEPLDGSNYKRWAQRLLIFFEQLEVDFVLIQDCPKRPTGTTVEPSDLDQKIAKYEKNNRLVR